MPPNDKTVVCYVCRHGRTQLNASNRFRGSANPPLDEVGIKQAHTLADFFESRPISHIFCSDKIRAVTTAQTIAKSKGIPIHKSESLRALNVGSFSGTLRTPESEACLQCYLDDPSTTIPGGESLNDFKSRILPCIQEAINICFECGTPPLVVGHSSIVHEVGNIVNRDHKSLLVEPGGCIAVYCDPQTNKFTAEAIFKPVKSAGTTKASVIT